MEFKYTDKELEIIKNTFADNDSLLITLRKILLQGNLNAVELAQAETLKNKAVVDVIRKVMLLDINLDDPIGSVSDMYGRLNLSGQVKEQMIPHIDSMNIVMDYLNKRMDVLLNGTVVDKIEFDKTSFEELSARNAIIKEVESALSFIKIIAGNKEESIDEQKKRLLKNSNK